MFCLRSSARLWISVSVSSVIFHLEVDCRLVRVEAGMTSTATSLMEVSPSLACLTNMLGAGSVICSVVVVGVSSTNEAELVIVDEDSPAASAATGRQTCCVTTPTKALRYRAASTAVEPSQPVNLAWPSRTLTPRSAPLTPTVTPTTASAPRPRPAPPAPTFTLTQPHQLFVRLDVLLSLTSPRP